MNLSSAGIASLPAGGYLVVASNTVPVSPTATVIRFSAAQDNIQNGSPDGVALFDTSTNALVDALSYEGSITSATIGGTPGYNLVEGTPVTEVDLGDDSLIRFPNGVDSDDAEYDWRLATGFNSIPTPGTSNGGEFLDCSADLQDNDGDAVIDEPGERCTPETTISPISVPAKQTNSTSADSSYSSNTDNSDFQCKLTTPSSLGAFEECGLDASTGSKSYTDLTEGNYTFEVKATDGFGNTDPTPASYSWTVDTTKPDLPVISSPADNSFDTDGNITLLGTAEAGSTVQIFDGMTPTGMPTQTNSGDWSVTLNGVANGSHIYSARATDAAGNASLLSNSRTVTVDTKKPTVKTTTPLNLDTGVRRNISPTATFSEKMKASTIKPTTCKLFKVNSDGSTTPIVVTVSLSTGGLTATLDPFGPDSTTKLAKNTKYKATVTTGAKDLAGNPLAKAKVWTFTTGSR